jgi:hypothetical protein
MTSIEIHERLTRLERSNRILKAILSVCLACVAIVFLMGAASTAPKIIEAEKFILEDGAGNERGELFATDKAWGLVLFNRNDTKAASIFVSSEMNGVILSDQNGNLRQSLTTDLDKSGLNIYRPGSDSAQFQVLDSPLGAALTFRDRTNNDRVNLGVSSKGSVLTLADEGGAIRAAVTGGPLGFVSYSKSGELDWAPGWDNFSPEEKATMKKLMPKPPN